MMENTYFLTSTRGGVGLPTALLKLLGLRTGEPVRLINDFPPLRGRKMRHLNCVNQV